MTLFSRVLVPLDGTPQAEVALTHLRPIHYGLRVLSVVWGYKRHKYAG